MHSFRAITVLIMLVLALGCSSEQPISSATLCQLPDATNFIGENKGYESLAPSMSQECAPYDQCVLSCIRAGCYPDIGGGCGHMCSQFQSSEKGKDFDQIEMAKNYYEIGLEGGCEKSDI